MMSFIRVIMVVIVAFKFALYLIKHKLVSAEATTSENIVKGVWKINGQYIGEDALNLPTGTYIINVETKVVK